MICLYVLLAAEWVKSAAGSWCGSWPAVLRPAQISSRKWRFSFVQETSTVCRSTASLAFRKHYGLTFHLFWFFCHLPYHNFNDNYNIMTKTFQQLKVSFAPWMLQNKQCIGLANYPPFHRGVVHPLKLFDTPKTVPHWRCWVLTRTLIRSMLFSAIGAYYSSLNYYSRVYKKHSFWVLDRHLPLGIRHWQ